MFPQRGGEDAVKMAAHGVFLLINPGGGVRALRSGRVGCGVGKKQKEKKASRNSSAVDSDNCMC